MSVGGGSEILREQDRVSVAPMIDVVLLLLIYFMVASTLIPTEYVFRHKLPSESTDPPVELPEEYLISVRDDGVILLDQERVASAGDFELPGLRAILLGLRSHAAQVPGGRLAVTVAPEPAARHGRVIDVLNVLSDVKIESVTFAYTGVGG